YQ
ncbi:hypothetical protein D027_4308B, partial [Vibrio parahaemolyticus 861]